MANRAMSAKVEKARRQAREAAHMELTKAPYLAPRIELPAYDVAMVRRIPAPKPRQRRTFETATRQTAARAAWVVGEYGLIRG